jgi:hypothetical protein
MKMLRAPFSPKSVFIRGEKMKKCGERIGDSRLESPACISREP